MVSVSKMKSDFDLKNGQLKEIYLPRMSVNQGVHVPKVMDHKKRLTSNKVINLPPYNEDERSVFNTLKGGASPTISRFKNQ